MVINWLVINVYCFSELVDAATEQYGSVLERNGDKIRKLTLVS